MSVTSQTASVRISGPIKTEVSVEEVSLNVIPIAIAEPSETEFNEAHRLNVKRVLDRSTSMSENTVKDSLKASRPT